MVTIQREYHPGERQDRFKKNFAARKRDQVPPGDLRSRNRRAHTTNSPLSNISVKTEIENYELSNNHSRHRASDARPAVKLSQRLINETHIFAPEQRLNGSDRHQNFLEGPQNLPAYNPESGWLLCFKCSAFASRHRITKAFQCCSQPPKTCAKEKRISPKDHKSRIIAFVVLNA